MEARDRQGSHCRKEAVGEDGLWVGETWEFKERGRQLRFPRQVEKGVYEREETLRLMEGME